MEKWYSTDIPSVFISGLAMFRSYDDLRKVTQSPEADLQMPELTRTSNMRKYMATMLQVYIHLVTIYTCISTSNATVHFLAHLSTKCSRWVIVIVFCLASVVRQLLLLTNQRVNWDETSQKASFQWPHQNSFNFFRSMQNSGFHGNEMIFFSKFFFSQTGWSIFK